MKTAEEYLELPYHVRLVPDQDDEDASGWVAEVEELPGVVSQGETPDEAVENVRDAMLGWVSIALEDGRAIPEPRDEAGYSGRFLVRLPVSLHAELARQAQLEGVSLNQFVANALAAVARWREPSRLPEIPPSLVEPLERAMAEIAATTLNEIAASAQRVLDDVKEPASRTGS